MDVTINCCDVVIQCQFLSGFTATSCEIQYGTDPDYQDLPNHDESPTSGGDSVVIQLSQPLMPRLTYYYYATATS